MTDTKTKIFKLTPNQNPNQKTWIINGVRKPVPNDETTTIKHIILFYIYDLCNIYIQYIDGSTKEIQVRRLGWGPAKVGQHHFKTTDFSTEILY